MPRPKEISFASVMRVTVLDPKKIIYEGNAKEVILPGESGEFSVLDFHQMFLACLMRGDIKVITNKPSQFETRIPIKKGIAKMLKNELMIIVELFRKQKQ